MKAAALVCILLLSGCKHRRAAPITGDAAFTAFADSYFKSLFTFYPTRGSEAGLHDYDALLENFSSSVIRDRLSDIRGQHARVLALMKGTLSQDNAIDAALLDGQLRSELQDLETTRVWRRNPLFYLRVAGGSIDVLMKRNFAPKRDRLLLMIERLRKMRPLLDALRDNVSEPPPEFTYLAARIVQGSIGYFRNTVGDWAKGAAGHDDALLSTFRSANGKVVSDLQVLEDYLKTDLKTVSTGTFAIGAEAFLNKLQAEEMIDVPLDRLLAIGEANLAKDYAAFVETAKQVAPGRSPAEAMKVLSSDHPDEKQLLEAAKSTLESLRQFLVDKNIVTLPSEGRPQVVETPTFLRSGIFAAMDSPGPFEKAAKEAFYYVTPTEPGWTPQHKEEHMRLFNRPTLKIISIHEVFPGHSTQFLSSPGFPTEVRKLVSVSSNAEGWAHYAEQMLLEEGFGGGDLKLRLAQLSEALLRDCRYIVGIKLHTEGMSVAEGARIFEEKGLQEPANALEEARRGTYDPTYLYYTAGKLQLYKLREDYRRKLGAGYSLGKFHDAFLKQGSIPIALVRKLMLGDEGGPTL